MKKIINFLKEEEGVTAIEYALIAALVTVVCVVAWGSLGTKVQSTITAVDTAMQEEQGMLLGNSI